MPYSRRFKGIRKTKQATRKNRLPRIPSRSPALIPAAPYKRADVIKSIHPHIWHFLSKSNLGPAMVPPILKTSPQVIDLRRSFTVILLPLLNPPRFNKLTILVRCQWWICKQGYQFTVLYLVVNYGSTGLCMQGIVFTPAYVTH